MSFGQKREAQTFERSLQEETRAVEDELPFDSDVEFSSVLFELPSIQAATVGRQPKVQAVVVHQVLGRPGPLAPCQVGGRAHNGHPEIGANSNGDHILCNELAWPNACIDLLRHDIGEPVIDDDLDVNVRVFWKNSP